MAECKVQKVICPKCKNQIEVRVWDKVELPYDAEQKERVMQNTFCRVDCVACGLAYFIAYNCQYNDLEHKYLVWMIPRMGEKEQNQIAVYNNQIQTDASLRLAQGGYRYRIVRDGNELREKVLIFDEGLDDRYIETLKMVYVPLIKKKVGEDCKIKGIFFDKKKDGGYQFIISFEDKPPMSANANMDIYEDMKVKLKDVVESHTPEGLCLIEANWALEIMMNRVEESPQIEL